MNTLPATRRALPGSLQKVFKVLAEMPPGFTILAVLACPAMAYGVHAWLTWSSGVPQLGPGQYVPSGPVIAQPPAAQPQIVQAPPSSATVTLPSSRVMPTGPMPPAQALIRDRAFATMPDSADPYPYRSRRLNLD